MSWGTELRQSAKEGRLTLERELELFILDRQDHVKRSIQPALNEGSVVILDRYYWSTAAYQGARGSDIQQIIATNEQFAPQPDLWIWLDVSPEEGLRRIAARGDIPNSFEQEQALVKAREIFQSLADVSGERVVRIDANEPLRQVHKQAETAMLHKAMGKISAGDLRPEQLNLTLELLGADPISDEW